MTPAALAHLAEIVLAAGERIKAIRNHGADSLESSLASIRYSQACIACNTSNLPAEDWQSIYPTRKGLEAAIAAESKRAWALAKAEAAK